MENIEKSTFISFNNILAVLALNLAKFHTLSFIFSVMVIATHCCLRDYKLQLFFNKTYVRHSLQMGSGCAISIQNSFLEMSAMT